MQALRLSPHGRGRFDGCDVEPSIRQPRGIAARAGPNVKYHTGRLG